MARDEPARSLVPTAAIEQPSISLIGRVDAIMAEKLRDGLAKAADDDDIAVELTTAGGDADLAGRLALDVRRAAARRRGALVFVGKTQVYSAGVTVMSAFPRERRFMSDDTIMLIHCRKLEQTVQLSGPIRTSLPLLQGLQRQIEVGLDIERQQFLNLIAGSDVTLDELYDKALYDWYLTADEARRRGLIAAIV